MCLSVWVCVRVICVCECACACNKCVISVECVVGEKTVCSFVYYSGMCVVCVFCSV